MSQGVKIEIETNLYDEIGQYLISHGINKTIVSGAYKVAIGKVMKSGRAVLKANTVERTGSLRKSVGSKVDRFPDRLTVYGILGYRKAGKKHQYWHVQGTKKRTTSSGANRGASPPASPDPLKTTESQLNSQASSILRNESKEIVEKAFKNANNKYGKKLAKL